MVRCTIAYHFTQLHQTPPKSAWYKVALDIISELNISCSVNTIIAIFEAVLVDPEYDGKVKHESVRTNRNMINIDSTEAQIAADVLKKGGSIT